MGLYSEDTRLTVLAESRAAIALPSWICTAASPRNTCWLFLKNADIVVKANVRLKTACTRIVGCEWATWCITFRY